MLFLLRISLGLVLIYAVLVLLAWLFQEPLAFPAPRAAVPDPKRLGIANGERIEFVVKNETRLVGWYLVAKAAAEGGERYPALLWFYGNGENIASIWPVLRDFQPPGAALLAVDYPGYGGSDGRTTEAGLYDAADEAYAALGKRAEVDPNRIYVYGRSLGSAVATYTAAHHEVAGLILESPFTSAADMSRHSYAIFPRFILRLSLDNLAMIKRVHCPVLVFHGTADRLVPAAMGMKVAAAAPGPVDLVLIEAAGHNDTYEVGGRTYREKLAAFVLGKSMRAEGH